MSLIVYEYDTGPLFDSIVSQSSIIAKQCVRGEMDLDTVNASIEQIYDDHGHLTQRCEFCITLPSIDFMWLLRKSALLPISSKQKVIQNFKTITFVQLPNIYTISRSASSYRMNKRTRYVRSSHDYGTMLQAKMALPAG